jgi:putative thioredoxin
MFPASGWTWHGPATVVSGPAWGGCLEILDFQLRAGRYLLEPAAYAGSVFYVETSEELPPATYGRRGPAHGRRAVLTGCCQVGLPPLDTRCDDGAMSQPSFNPYGAVDLSSLAPRPAPAAGAPNQEGAAPVTPGPGPVIDVTEADFQTNVIDTSMTVPVVIDFWADWCGPCKQLSPVLERLAHAAGGTWVLAKIDLDANPRLGQAFQVQSIPAIFAVVKGQPLPLFQGAVPEAEVRRFIDELLRVAAENGVNGRVAAGAADAEPVQEPAEDPRYDEAYDAIERGDLDAATAAYRSLLDQSPADPDAQAGLGQVELLRRTTGLDGAAVRARANENLDDVAAQTAAADLDLLSGLVEDAFNRLIELVRRTSGVERDQAREHLIGLFGLVGSDDERVAKARTSLANALF